MDIFEYLGYSFVQKAIVSGLFVASACSILGFFLVLHRMSSIGDGLSHTSFAAVSLGLFCGIHPVSVALPVVILASIFIQKISESAKLSGDTAIGIVSCICVSSGVIFASLSKEFNSTLFNYLFGNVLTITMSEVYLIFFVFLSLLFIVKFFYWELLSVTFDKEYSKTIGIDAKFINYLLSILTAITIVFSVKVVGTALVSGLLILPASTALQISKRFKAALFCTWFISCLSFISGFVVAICLNLPVSSVVIIMNGAIFLCTLVYKVINVGS